MSFKNVASIAVLVVAVAFSIQLVFQTDVEARPASYQAVAAQQQNIAVQQVEFARLQVEADGDQVTWLIGGNGQVRTESLRQAYQRLGGRGRATFSNMLDQIGSLG